MKQKIKDILTISTTYGWEYFTYDEQNGMLSVVKEEDRINVYTTKMTVGVCVKGFSQSFIKRCTMDKLEDIFINTKKYIK